MPGQELDPSRAATPGLDATAPGAGEVIAPPAGTPSAPDQEKKGQIEQAKANVQMAINILEKSLPELGSESEEGAIVLKALTTLSKKFSGKKSQDLVPAELMQLFSGQPENIKQQMAKEMGQGSGQPPMPGA
jgi:hypothetical protein